MITRMNAIAVAVAVAVAHVNVNVNANAKLMPKPLSLLLVFFCFCFGQSILPAAPSNRWWCASRTGSRNRCWAVLHANHCGPLQNWCRYDVGKVNCTNAQMHKCTSTQMHKCTNAQMRKCTNANAECQCQARRCIAFISLSFPFMLRCCLV